MADDDTEAFPTLSPVTTEAKLKSTEPKPPGNDDLSRARSSSTGRRTRGASIKQAILNSNPPLGMWQATGEVGSKIPTLPEIRNGAFSDAGWSHEGQMEHRGSSPREIHRRRLARTSTSSTTRTRKSSITAATPVTPRIEEEEREFFPRRGTVPLKGPVIEETPARGDDEDVARAAEPANSQPDVSAHADVAATSAATKADVSARANGTVSGPDDTGTYPNGYRFPRKHTWTQSTVIGLKAFWKFFLTPFGFLVTVYGLNVVGWGAMIFFVLLEAAPAMCHPSCSAENSPRKIWIEIDSQVLNALFCVTAFGLAPWRFRDFYYLMRWRALHKNDAHRRLAGLYRGWYRLPGSDQLADDIGPPPMYNKRNPRTAESPPPYTDDEIQRLESNQAIPLPATSMPEPPLTGIRAPPSRSWTLDFVILMYIANTFLQVGLCAFMWCFNRHNRPSWGVGLFITMGCLSGIFAGIMVFIEGSRVKKFEGIPIQEYDVLESVEDYHERKAKEDAKVEKKESKHQRREERHILRSEKVKGHQWFTRH